MNSLPSDEKESVKQEQLSEGNTSNTLSKKDEERNESKKSGQNLNLPATLEDKLDTDFLYYLCQVNECLSAIPSEKDKVLPLAWLDVLLGELYVKEKGKRDRNIFLSQLLLAMMEDNVSRHEVFSKPPPGYKSAISDAAKVFGLAAPEEEDITHFKIEEGVNKDLDVCEFSHLSEDKRTFMATKTIKGGLMAYIGVSVGDNPPKWISHMGEPRMIPEIQTIKVKRPCENGPEENEGIELTRKKLREYRQPTQCTENTKHEILKKMLTLRKPSEVRRDVVDFYLSLMNDIKEAIELIEKNGTLPMNEEPSIAQMLRKIEAELRSSGNKELLGMNPLQKHYRLLNILLRTLDIKIKMLEERSLILDETDLDKQAERDSGFEFVTVTSRLPLETSDSVWMKTVEHEFSQNNMKLLNEMYPDCVVQMLLTLAEEERMSILLQEMDHHNRIIMGIKRGFLEHTTVLVDGIKEYKDELERITGILTEINYKKAALVDDTCILTEDLDGEEQDEYAVSLNHLLKAKNKLKEYTGKTHNLVMSRLVDLMEFSDKAKTQFEDESSLLKKEIDVLKKEICSLTEYIKKVQCLKRYLKDVYHVGL